MDNVSPWWQIPSFFLFICKWLIPKSNSRIVSTHYFAQINPHQAWNDTNTIKDVLIFWYSEQQVLTGLQKSQITGSILVGFMNCNTFNSSMTEYRLSNILYSKLLDASHISIPGKNISPKEKCNTQKLICGCPKQKEDYVDSFSWGLVLHLKPSFFQDIHYGSWKLKLKGSKIISSFIFIKLMY